MCVFVAGIVNVLMTTPLWVVNTRLKLQGAKFRTKDLQSSETKKYKGIIGEWYLLRITENISEVYYKQIAF